MARRSALARRNAGSDGNYKAGKINGDHIRIGLLIAVGMFGGTFFGAKLSTQLPAAQLQKIFSIFLVLIAARLWFSAAA